MKENRVAQALQIIGGLIIIFGLIGAIQIADDFNGTIGLASFIVCVFQGVLFFGFAEVIDLLERGIGVQMAYSSNTKVDPVDQIKTPTKFKDAGVFTEEIKILAELKDAGVLTEEEFNAKKQVLLEKIK